MSRHIRRVTGVLAVFIYMTICVRAADIANLQLLVASPDPVQAGTDVTFQIIIVNAGTETWDAKSYTVEAELYDLQKQYLLKSDRVLGEHKVKSGGKALMYVPLTIPEYYSGIYYFRINIMHGAERLYRGSLAPLRVNPLPILPPKPPVVKLGGNAILSYKSDTSNDWKDYTGNLSVNLVGRVMDRSVLFNLYTIHDQDDPIDIYTILFNYYGSMVRIAMGDILPEFNELSVFGTGMRGVSWENKTGRYKTTLVGARIVESNEGSADSDGTYRRMLYTGSEEIELPWGFSMGMNMLYGSDIESSVDLPGPTLKPEKNIAYGGVLTWKGYPFLTLKGQYQSSSWTEDTISSATATNDKTDIAYRGDIDIETDIWTLSSYVQRTGPDFNSFGAPEANADRVTMDVLSEFYFFNFWTLSGGYNSFYDDLDNDPTVIRTIQQITSGGTSFNFPTGTSLSGSYSNNLAYGEVRDIQDNQTKTMVYGISQSVWGQSIAVSHQTSEFKDTVNPEGDLDSITETVTLNCMIGQRFSGSLGASLTTNKDLFDQSEEEDNSYSFSINQNIMKDTLTMQLWGTYAERSDTDNTKDSQELNGNVEVTYVCNANLSITAGVSLKNFADVVDAALNNHETGANIRLNYNF